MLLGPFIGLSDSGAAYDVIVTFLALEGITTVRLAGSTVLLQARISNATGAVVRVHMLDFA
jgi:hypothetical protein